jgi:hypothetical protein
VDEGPIEIEAHIRSTRRRLEINLQELEHRVKDAADWRVHFSRHTAIFLGAAFVGGLILSSALGGRKRG